MRLTLYTVSDTDNNGSCRNFKPSLKGRGARQTASTRVVELSIRYMRLFRTSPTDLYSYGTCVNMSISSHPIRRGMRIMRSSRLVRSTGLQHHHAHLIYPCRERRVGNGKASNHADPMHATRMQPAGSWAARATSSRYAGTSAHRASSSAKRDMQLITHTSCSPLMPGLAAKH